MFVFGHSLYGIWMLEILQKIHIKILLLLCCNRNFMEINPNTKLREQ
jgi:hypothetical protein